MGKKVLVIAFTVAILLFSSVVCSLSPQTDLLTTQAAATIEESVGSLESTLMAMATAAPTIIIEGATRIAEELEQGGISGNLSYPSEAIPALRVVVFRVENGQATGEYHYVDTLAGTGAYTIADLEPGTYWVVAYVNQDVGQESGFAGGYTQAVICGLTTDCNDHSLILVTVQPGRITPDIDPGDWYAPTGTFPDNPTE